MFFGNLPTKRIVKTRKRVGRGGKKGKTCGRGKGGQHSRTGSNSKIGLLFEGGQVPLARRIPKRGFTQRDSVEYQVVSLDDLNTKFNSGDKVDMAGLKSVGLVKGNTHKVKIKVLANGDITKALHLTVNAVSETAKNLIEKVGGSVTLTKENASVASL